ncbi:MAG TPA: glycosyltransferase family 4 protein [Burkholderiales bacterium]|nr:glycosyltransferase family 4 protein [Burkholderiales bacterium]
MSARGLRIALVGPLPPPSGGMANQTRQLARLLSQEAVDVEIVQTNPAYRPQWIQHARGVRALFRLVPYLVRLWRAAGRVQIFHVMANSGWAWHLFAAPAVWIARLRGVPVVVNYRGGGADEFLARSSFWVRPTMRLANRLIVPSGFLLKVFERYGLVAGVVPNVVDLGRFTPRPAVAAAPPSAITHIIVTRNLEPLYDIGTALRAFAIVRDARPGAHVSMTVAGSGPEQARLEGLAQELGLAAHVTFIGRLDNDFIGGLYQRADIFVNPSLVDNTPISILESLASGVPVVSTSVGGIPYVVEHRKTALLVPPGNPEAMASAVLELLDDPGLALRLARAGKEAVQKYAWSHVCPLLIDVYLGLMACSRSTAATGIK